MTLVIILNVALIAFVVIAIVGLQSWAIATDEGNRPLRLRRAQAAPAHGTSARRARRGHRRLLPSFDLR